MSVEHTTGTQEKEEQVIFSARAFCEACGKHRHAKLCDFPLMGSKRGQTCDRKLCESCAVKVGRGLDYCPTHARVSKTKETP